MRLHRARLNIAVFWQWNVKRFVRFQCSRLTDNLGLCLHLTFAVAGECARECCGHSQMRMSWWDRQRVNRYGCTDTCASLHIRARWEKERRDCELSVQMFNRRAHKHVRAHAHTHTLQRDRGFIGVRAQRRRKRREKFMHWRSYIGSAFTLVCAIEKNVGRVHAKHIHDHSRKPNNNTQRTSRAVVNTLTHKARWIDSGRQKERERESDIEDDRQSVWNVHLPITRTRFA